MNQATIKIAQAAYSFSQRESHLGHLPGPILRDLARNDSAPREWRKAAVELMLDRGFKEVNHPDLSGLLAEVRHQRDAKEEVQAIVESAIEAPLEDHDPQRDEIAAILNVPVEQVHQLSITPSQAIKELAEQVALVPPPDLGPFKASFTTKSQNQDDVA